MRNIRMANDHAHKSLSWILRPRTEVTRRSTGAALRPASDDVAPTRAGVSPERRAVRERSREAGRQVDGTVRITWCVAAPARFRQFTTHRDEHDQPNGVSER